MEVAPEPIERKKTERERHAAEKAEREKFLKCMASGETAAEMYRSFQEKHPRSGKKNSASACKRKKKKNKKEPRKGKTRSISNSKGPVKNPKKLG